MTTIDKKQSPLKRALVVIDVQNEYITGNLLIGYPDPQVSLRNIGLAIDAARTAGLPILAIQHTASLGAAIFQKGSFGWELHEVVKSRKIDYHIEKKLPSIFTNTDAASWFRMHGVDTLTILGFMTQNCNASTVYQAMHEGFHVEVLNDATGAVAYANAAGEATAEEIHRVFNVVFHSNFGAVIDTADWIQDLGSGTVFTKSNVPASYRVTS